jgi:hypothetical protein
MAIEIVERVSAPGDDINEDCASAAQFASGTSTAWVIDGATGLADREWVAAGPTDAAWLAETLSALLTACDPGAGDARAYFAGLLARLAEDYRAAVPGWRELPPWALPSAAATWLRVRARTLELAWQGDCVALVETREGVVIAGADEARAWEDDINDAVRARLATLASAPASVMAEMLGELRRRRARLNQPDGYWMIGVDPRAAAAIDVRTLTLEAPTRVLLASDGLWRLVDHFRVYDAAGLLAASFDVGLAHLLAELRALEADDAECRRVPRVKPRDDATGVTLIATPG